MQVGQVPVDDVHLIVKQRRNEEWDQVASPRANRFMLHHDINYPLVSSLEEFSSALPGFNPQLVVVGGLQMMVNFPFERGRTIGENTWHQETGVKCRKEYHDSFRDGKFR